MANADREWDRIWSVIADWDVARLDTNESMACWKVKALSNSCTTPTERFERELGRWTQVASIPNKSDHACDHLKELLLLQLCAHEWATWHGELEEILTRSDDEQRTYAAKNELKSPTACFRHWTALPSVCTRTLLVLIRLKLVRIHVSLHHHSFVCIMFYV